MTFPLDPALAAGISRDLGVGVRLSMATAPLPTTALSMAEMARLAELPGRARQDEWRRGRAALKDALRSIGEPEDTARLALPHRLVSLTHSGQVAVAVAATDGATLGVGVDLEMDRAPRLESARFFLTAAEQAWLHAQPEASRRAHIVRLWTVKESLFKADADNASAALHDYCVDDPAVMVGGATRGAPSSSGTFTYATRRFDGGTLTVAALVHRSARSPLGALDGQETR
jgi:phosphopantetheinyl transferase (holo-ACP synthase)